jgi:transposase
MPMKRKNPQAANTANTLDEANQLIKALWDRFNDLEERGKQTSRNSSRPPPSDGPGAMQLPTRKVVVNHGGTTRI